MRSRSANAQIPSTVGPRVPTQHPSRPEIPAGEIGDGIELGDGVPYHNTVVRLAREHPELNISNPEALQSTYTDLCERRAALEASVARINEISPTQNLVEIPAYLTQGKALLDRLSREVTAMYGDADGQKIMTVLGPVFAGDNHDLGKSPQKLAITKVIGETYDYQVVRETVVRDPVTQQPIGAARGIDTLRKDAMGMYAQQLRFFPRG